MALPSCRSSSFRLFWQLKSDSFVLLHEKWVEDVEKNGDGEKFKSFVGNTFAAHHGLVLPICRAKVIYVDDDSNVANDGSSWTLL